MRLLMLEADSSPDDVLAEQLRSEGNEVDRIGGHFPVPAVRPGQYDAVLMCGQSSEGSGLDWVRALRAQLNAVPILILAGRASPEHRVAALDSGADDYMVRPLSTLEIVARIRAIQRRSSSPLPGARIRLRTLEIDLGSRLVWLEGRQVMLTHREWLVLQVLATRAGSVVSRSELHSALSLGAAANASNAVEVHISHLRRKLDKNLIETIRGVGYRAVV